MKPKSEGLLRTSVLALAVATGACLSAHADQVHLQFQPPKVTGVTTPQMEVLSGPDGTATVTFTVAGTGVGTCKARVGAATSSNVYVETFAEVTSRRRLSPDGAPEASAPRHVSDRRRGSSRLGGRLCGQGEYDRHREAPPGIPLQPLPRVQEGTAARMETRGDACPRRRPRDGRPTTPTSARARRPSTTTMATCSAACLRVSGRANSDRIRPRA